MNINNSTVNFLVGGLGALSTACFGIGVILETHAKSLNKTNEMKTVEEVASKIFQTLPAFGVLTVAGSLMAGSLGLGIGAVIGGVMILTPIMNKIYNTEFTEKADKMISLTSKVIGTSAAVLLTGYFSGLPAAAGVLIIAGTLNLINLDILELKTVNN